MFPTRSFADALEHAARLHRRLLERARDTAPADPGAVMSLAIAALMHGLLERTTVLTGARFVTPELRNTFDDEHEALLDALALMAELADDPDGAGDLASLSAAVHERLTRHIERDQRVIYGSLARLDAFTPSETRE